MLGQDTEFFVFDTKENRHVPAHSVGILKEKIKLSYAGSYFRDGYAVEFNGPASFCRSGIWENLAAAVRQFKMQRPLFREDPKKPPRYKLTTDPVAYVDLEEIRTAPKDLHVLGCHPTYDPYKEERKEVHVDPLKMPFRTSGAHLHYSYSAPDMGLDKLGLLAKYCDLAIGLPFTVIYGDDKEFLRRSLYGQAGEFRQQKYPGTWCSEGFEYRVLSSRLYHHPAIFGLVVGIFKYLLDDRYELFDAGWNSKLDEPLQRAINTGEGAVSLLEEFAKVLENIRHDPDGMNGIGYIPKDWGAAILKLAEMRRKAEHPLNVFQLEAGQLQAHWGWSEYNDHNKNKSLEDRRVSERSSTVGHRPLIKEPAWEL